MEAKKIVKIKKSFESMITATFRFIVAIINVVFTVFLLFGACAAIILLYKAHPDIALILLKPMLVIFSLLAKIIQISLVVLFILAFVYLIFLIKEIFETRKEKFKKAREKDRNKFMDEIVIKLKKGSKNK